MPAEKTTPHPLARTAFRAALLRWFDRNRRPLPWRQRPTPYRVWVSEIMLQQTRVSTVKDRYQTFMKRFPSVKALARAKPAEVLAAWSGLGYYRRARALHAAARRVVRAGSLPRTAEQWRALPGIGRYTAAAIASIAFGEACAVVDGNVERVLARLAGVSGKDAWNLAQRLLDSGRPGDFNQAMMELGSTMCLPQQPNCAACPIFAWCGTRGPSAPALSSPRRKKVLKYLLARRGSSLLLVERAPDLSLMPGMWELPPGRNGAGAGKPLLRLRHSITNTDYKVDVYAAAGRIPARGGHWVRVADLERLPLTGLARKILRAAMVI